MIFDLLKKINAEKQEEHDMLLLQDLRSYLILNQEAQQKETKKLIKSKSRLDLIMHMLNLASHYDTQQALSYFSQAIIALDVEYQGMPSTPFRVLDPELVARLRNLDSGEGLREEIDRKYGIQRNRPAPSPRTNHKETFVDRNALHNKFGVSEEMVECSRCYAELGRRYERRYLFEEARKAYQRALDLEPIGTYSVISLGNVLIKMGKIDEAIQLLKDYKKTEFYKENDDVSKRSIRNRLVEYQDKKARGYVYKPRKKKE